MSQEQETRERILEASFQLFKERGYENVSLRDITEKAGISRGGLFYHFDSKYDLARDSLIWWIRTRMEPRFFESMKGSTSPESILTGFIDMMIGIMKDDVGFTRFYWSIFDEAMRKEEDYGVWMNFLEQYVVMISGIYGQMGVGDPEMKAMTFLSTLDGIALYYSMMDRIGKEFDLKALREELIRTYVTFEESGRK